jgi:outer membrane protein insertion porin family
MNFKVFVSLLIIISISSSASAGKFSFTRQPIEKVEINGNLTFTDSHLKSFLLTKENRWFNIFGKRRISQTNLIVDSGQIERFYGREGFLFTKVTPSANFYKSDSAKAVVTFNVVEGKRVYADKLEIVGGLPKLNSSLDKFTKKIKINEPVNDDAVKAAGQAIRDFYGDNGYALAKVEQNYLFSADSAKAIIKYAIAESSLVYNGDITIAREGRPVTDDNIMFRELRTKKGSIYNRSLNIESQQRLYSTGLLKFVALKRTGDLRFDDAQERWVTDFRLVISERKPNFVNFRTGVEQDPDFNSVFTTSASWGNRSLWGSGRKLIMNVSNSLKLIANGTGNEPDTTGPSSFADLFSIHSIEPVKWAIGLNYVEPWFLGYRMPLTMAILYEPRNKNPIINKYYDRVSGEPSLAREINRYTNIKFSGKVEFVNIHDVSAADQEYFRQEGDNSVRRQLSFYGQRDTRDNILIPQRGSYSYFSFDFVGNFLGGDFSFVKSEFYWSRFNRLFGDNIVASRFRIGVLKEMGATGGSSADDRFTLGGANTVRGYAENSLGPKWTAADSVAADLIGLPKGGKLMLLGNLEIRRSLFWRFGGAAFTDIGSVSYDMKDFKLNKIESSAGFGLHFFTPIGPIRFDWAVRLKKQLDLGESGWDLAILYAF